MKSRTQEHGNSKSIQFNGIDTLRIARSLALATALTLLVQPLVTPVFAQTKSTNSGGKIAFRLLAQTKSDSEDADADEAKKDAEASKKEADKAKKESEKADKKAKETAKKAAEEAKKAAADAKKAKIKKDEKVDKTEKAEADAKKADAKKADAEDENVDSKKVKEVKKADNKKDAKAASDATEKAANKAKKKGWFGGKAGEKPIESGEVTEPTVSVERKPIEVKPAAGAAKANAGASAKGAGKPAAGAAAKSAAAKSGTAAAKPVSVVAPADTTSEAQVEKPVLLPDKALVSVLKDISKSLSDVNTESGVESADEKVIVGLAKQLLDKALGSSELEYSRILAPEHSSTAKNSMTTEAWASGDISISDKLRGSVATVWGKRVNGSLHVTIAGECQDKVLSNGDKVGEFIVVIKGRSPVKSGFDIQSQSDVSYWIGALNTVSVDNAVLRLKDKVEGEEGTESAPAEKPAETKGEVKKKSLVVLETILTRRGLEYLQALARYEHQQQTLIALQTAEANLTDADDDTTDDTEGRSTGDEVKPSRVTRAAVDDGEDRVTRRSRSEEDDEDSDRTIRRKRDDSGDDAATSRRSKSDDDEDGRVSRRSREDEDEDDGPAKKATSMPDVVRKDEDYSEHGKIANATKSGEAKPANTRAAEKVSDGRNANDSAKASDKKNAGAEKTASNQPAQKRSPTSDDDFNPGRVTFNPNGEESEKPIAQDASAKPSDSSWRDDWSKDGGDATGKLTTVQASALPKTETKVASSQIATSKPSANSSLTRISMASPSPASAVGLNRTWESPALNAAPHAPSLDATLLIPERAIAGQFLTVVVQNKDHQPERSVELSFNGATLETDLNGQVSYMVPDDQPPGHTLHIGLAERPELNTRVVDILQPLDDSNSQRAPRIDRVSQVVAADGILVVDGHDFDGFAERNRLVIDNEHAAKVIASSPVQLRVLVPAKLSPGQHSVTINSTDLRSAPAKFDFVKTEIEQPDLRKTKGVLNKITVRVQGTKQPVPVRVINKTPDVIKFSRGDNMLVTTSGGADNSYVVGVKQLKKGDYKVEASLEI